jgi:hypothetical protein
MAMNTPSVACSLTTPVLRLRSRTPVTFCWEGSRISASSLSQMKRIFAFARARSCMIREARSSSRRCTTTTSLQ